MKAIFATAITLIKERFRRTSTLLFLFVHVVYFFLPFPASVRYRNARGLYTSGYAGAFTAMRSHWIFALMAFHVIRSSIEEDRLSGMGELLASTPVKKVTYLLGKLLGSFSYSCMLLIVVYLLALVSQVIRAEGPLRALSLAWPFVLFTIPAIVFTTGIGLTLSMVPLVDQWPGDVLFVVVFLLNREVSRRLSGSSALDDSILAYLDQNPSAFTIAGQEKAFYWPGMPVAWSVIWPRLSWILLGIGLTMAASLVFDRFRVSPRGRWRIFPRDTPSRTIESQPTRGSFVVTVPKSPALNNDHILRASLTALVAEILLTLKRRWWYLLGCVGATISSFFVSREDLNLYLIPLILLLPISVIADLGCREEREGTSELVFIAPYNRILYPLWKWSSGFVLTSLALTGPLFIRIAGGRLTSALALIIGINFLVSMAVSLGILTGGYRVFVTAYIILWWVLVTGMNKRPPLWLDWSSLWYGGKYPLVAALYLILSIGLISLTALGTKTRAVRGRQLGQVAEYWRLLNPCEGGQRENDDH